MAAGVLVIPEGGEKPTKPSKDNNYVRFRLLPRDDLVLRLGCC